MLKNSTNALKLTRLSVPTVAVGSNRNILQPLHHMVPTAAHRAPLHRSRTLTHLHQALVPLLPRLRVLLLHLVEPMTTRHSMHSTMAHKLAVLAAQVVKPIRMPRMEDTRTTSPTTSTICSSNNKHKEVRPPQHQVAANSRLHRRPAIARMAVVTTLYRHRPECEGEWIDANKGSADFLGSEGRRWFVVYMQGIECVE